MSTVVSQPFMLMMLGLEQRVEAHAARQDGGAAPLADVARSSSALFL